MRYTHALITRPSPQLEALAARLERAQVQAVRVPAFRFEARERSVAPDDDWRLAAQRLLLFTSPRAVEFGLPALPGAMLSDARLAAIGPATTRALAAAGFDALQAPGPAFDSEALLAEIDERLAPGAAVILAAPGGREALQRGLAARRWTVRLVPVYERVLVEPGPGTVEALESAGRVISFWTSGTALEHVLDRLSDGARRRVRAGTAIVISERLASLARDRGMVDVRLAEGPSNDDLVRCFQGLDR